MTVWGLCLHLTADDYLRRRPNIIRINLISLWATIKWVFFLRHCVVPTAVLVASPGLTTCKPNLNLSHRLIWK